MRIVLLMIMALLAGCNSSDDDSSLQQQISAIPNEATQIAALRAQVDSLQSKINEMRLIGKPNSGNSSNGISPTQFRTMGEIIQGVAAVSFGPCADMGTQEGFSSLIGDALSSISKTYKTCTGYHVAYMTLDGSVKVAPRLFWDGPCINGMPTGNPLQWEAAGFGYDTGDLHDGIVFNDPSGISNTTLYVPAAQTPQPIFIQSVWVTSNPGCQVDQETQLMYTVSANIPQTTGVPNSPVGKFTNGAP